jgi:hypothetical protein
MKRSDSGGRWGLWTGSLHRHRVLRTGSLRELDFSLPVHFMQAFRWMRPGLKATRSFTCSTVPQMYGIAAWGASSQLQEKNVEEMRCFEREGIMGIVTLSGSAVLQERTSTLMHQWARTLQKRDIFCCQKSIIPSHRNSEHESWHARC